MSKKDIQELYRLWRKENGNQKPNRVIVRMYWEDEGPRYDKVDTIALETYDCDTDIPGDDGWILWYADGLKGLYALLKPGNGSDFVVTEVLEFYKRPAKPRHQPAYPGE